MDAVEKLASDVSEKQSSTKTERRELLQSISSVNRQLRGKLPFILQMFNEKVEQVTAQAKGEIEARASDMLRQLGTESARNGKASRAEHDLPGFESK